MSGTNSTQVLMLIYGDSEGTACVVWLGIKSSPSIRLSGMRVTFLKNKNKKKLGIKSMMDEEDTCVFFLLQHL